MKLSTPQAIEIYNLYPRKLAKPDAIKAILRAIARDGFETVRDRTKLFSAKATEAMQFDYEQKFIPYPATFFNREQYNDDFDAMFPKSKPKASGKPTPELLSSKLLKELKQS